MLKIDKDIRLVEFVRRQNRFQGFVKIDGVETMVHVPNTGRCKEILIPGCTVVLRSEDNPARKTKYDLIAGFKGDRLINIDSHIPNKVVEEALKKGRIEQLKKYEIIEREKTFGNSRFDFKLTDKDNREYYLEIKGVTLEDNGKTMFPDAPTDRGRKHLMELVEVVESGRRGGVLFLIQMEGVEYFTPYRQMDEAFSDALTFAYEHGVDVFAFDCKVGVDFITLNNRVEVRL